MTELEERIVDLIAKETGIKPKKVHLDSRLAQDIGMDGDDAVDFFEKYGEKFHVDLNVLGNHWDRHFLPEGGLPPLGSMVVIGVGVVVGGLLHEAVKWFPMWAAMIVVVALLCWIYGRFFNEPQGDKTPITVRDLVDAASSGRWRKHYEEPADSLFQTLQ